MSTTIEVAGNITFRNNEAKRKAVQALIEGNWGKIVKVDGKEFFAGINGSGEVYEEDYELSSMDSKNIKFCCGPQNNLTVFLNSILGNSNSMLDKEKTNFKVSCYDGTFSLAEYSDGFYEVLQDDEVEEIIGMKISEINYEDEDSPEYYMNAIEKADSWMES